MKVLVIGAGGVGSSIANIASRRDFLTSMVLADRDITQAEAAVARLNDPRFRAVQVDASDVEGLRSLIQATSPDLVINSVDPRFVMPIFIACEEEGVNYLDMAMSLTKPHPVDPFNKTGVKFGDEQFARAEAWKNNFALLGMGIEPGLSNIFAKYAADEIFSRIDLMHVMDGSNLEVQGYEFAPSFSIWTTIEECLNPPVMWERGRGWYTTEPFSGAVTFDFPEGIGPVECVNVEHEEVILIPKYVDAGQVAFKFGLGEKFIGILKAIHSLGLDSTEEVHIPGTESVSISPRDFLATILPNPAKLGPLMTGKTCAGLLVKGLDKSGNPKAIYLYHVVDNAVTMAEYGDQAVVWQTAINPVAAMELIHEGAWKPTGVNGPELNPPLPFLQKLIELGSPWGIRDEPISEINA
jgi:saccharopine dehydrogenase-like NADP-dependent oxidoreductase